MSKQAFREHIEAISAAAWNKSSLSEAGVRQGIVLRLLFAAGFDVWDPQEVTPEEANAAKNRPDLIITTGPDLENQAFVLEIKRHDSPLTDGELGQAMSYAGQKGIRWTVLTNGHDWVFADEKKSGPYKNRIVLELSLLKANTETFASDLFQLLDRNVWQKGKFEAVLQLVQKDLNKRQERAKILREKTPLLEGFARENTIADIGRAADLMVKLGLLSEFEKDLLTTQNRDQTKSIAENDKEFALKVQIEQTRLLPQTPKTHSRVAEVTFLYLQGKHVKAKAILLDDGGLEVQPGSTAVAETVPSFDERGGLRGWLKHREQLIVSQSLQPLEDGTFVYLKAVKYETPSAAGAAILGRTVWGTRDWKTDDGQSYRDVVDTRII